MSEVKHITYFENGMAGKPFATNPRLVRSGKASTCFGEMTPCVYKDRLMLVAAGFPYTPVSPFGDNGALWIGDALTGEVTSIFASGYGFPSAFVWEDRVHVFASVCNLTSSGSTLIECLYSDDLKTWNKRPALEALPDELLFNQSICRDNDRFVMAFEAKDDKYPPFTLYFAESSDLVNWTRIPGAVFGKDRYAACPAIRYVDGWYYLFYLEHRTPRWWFEMCVVRSKDLIEWEHSPRGPVLQPEACELCNSSDMDLVEFNGKVYVFYCYGNQKGMGTTSWAEFDGSLAEFVNWYFPGC